jgi:hypothetical protein
MIEITMIAKVMNTNIAKGKNIEIGGKYILFYFNFNLNLSFLVSFSLTMTLEDKNNKYGNSVPLSR